MSKPLSDARLAEIREREQMSTEGPWVRWADQEHIPGWDGFYVVGDDVAEGEEGNPAARVYTVEDAEFIAHARRDVPDLLAEVDRLRKRVADMEEDSAFLNALQVAGVDNWSGYDYACELARDDDA